MRHPQTTVRWRLTLLYGGLFLVSGAVLLAITYSLVARAPIANGSLAAIGGVPTNPPAQSFMYRTGSLSRGSRAAGPRNAGVPPSLQELLRSQKGRVVVRVVGAEQRVSDLHQLVIESGIALAIMAIICGALGWVVAGRVLRPLRTMTLTTQQISEANLNQRLAMQGPRDELRRLADTIDGLLERLERAFDAQRRFVANASHELRTPLTAARAMLELVMTDPDATVEAFRSTCDQVLEESEQQEQLIDALLDLARSQRGLERREPVDLAVLVGAVLEAHEGEATARRVQLDASLHAAPVWGDRRLIELLVSNLVENALRHNVEDGSVEVEVRKSGAEATLSVTNTGPLVPPEEVDRLLQPFQRRVPDRVGPRDGLGLGLSIVAAIASAHGASLQVRPRTGGGLQIEVRFPARPGSPQGDPHPARPAASPAESRPAAVGFRS